MRVVYTWAYSDEVLYININGMEKVKTNILNEKVKGKLDNVGGPSLTNYLQ